jgi:predicted membrane protein
MLKEKVKKDPSLYFVTIPFLWFFIYPIFLAISKQLFVVLAGDPLFNDKYLICPKSYCLPTVFKPFPFLLWMLFGALFIYFLYRNIKKKRREDKIRNKLEKLEMVTGSAITILGCIYFFLYFQFVFSVYQEHGILQIIGAI